MTDPLRDDAADIASADEKPRVIQGIDFDILVEDVIERIRDTGELSIESENVNGADLALGLNDATVGELAKLFLHGQNSVGARVDYAELLSKILTNTSGSEDGALEFMTMLAGTLAKRMVVEAGVQIGTPTGGDKGAGTLNASAELYKNGVAVLAPNVVNAFTRQQYFTRVSLTDAASITWNLDTQQNAFVEITANRALANPTNKKNMGFYTLFVKQGAGAPNLLSYGTDYDWGDLGPPVLSTGANKIDILTFISDGTDMFGSWGTGYG